MHQTRFINNMVARRNDCLQRFLSDINHEVNIIGNPETPAIIIDNQYCLSAYVHNFNLYFVDNPDRGKIIASFKLRQGVTLSADEFEKIIKKQEQKKIYKIKHRGTDLFLAGYNFQNKGALVGKFPVFASKKFKVYFNKAHADGIVEDYSDYPLEVI